MKKLLMLAGAGALVATASAGGTWTEMGDAGDLPPGQFTEGTDPLTAIMGTLSSETDVDMFAIRILDVAAFRATTEGGAGFDTQLFLFREGGFGVTHNDDSEKTTNLQSTITSRFVTATGPYYIAISAYNRDATGTGGLLIWNNTPFRAERAPDGPGASTNVQAWSGTGAFDTYTIALTGAGFNVPEPATMLALASGLGVLVLRRRRR